VGQAVDDPPGQAGGRAVGGSNPLAPICESELRELLLRETRCCSFFDFEMFVGAESLALVVRVPVGSEAALAFLLGLVPVRSASARAAFVAREIRRAGRRAHDAVDATETGTRGAAPTSPAEARSGKRRRRDAGLSLRVM
jgi:hypothetical protein